MVKVSCGYSCNSSVNRCMITKEKQTKSNAKKDSGYLLDKSKRKGGFYCPIKKHSGFVITGKNKYNNINQFQALSSYVPGS